MIKKGTIYLSIVFLLPLFLAQGVKAAGEVEYVLEETYTSMVPIFMSGHDGDPNWISGYNVTGDIYLGGSKIGTLCSTIMLLNPPMSMTEMYDSGFVHGVYDITDYGTFEITSNGLSLSSSTSPTAGDIVFAWSGSIGNGTYSLANTYGLSSGTAIANIYTGQGSGKETVRLRFGY